MLRICLCVLTGAYALALCRDLPSDVALTATIGVAGICLCCKFLRTSGFVLLGLIVTWIAARAMLADRLAPELQGQTLTITATIVDFPERRAGSIRFVVATVDSPELPERIRLTWYDGLEIPRIGETWRLQVRLRRPRGFANPAGFDYELWLARQRIGATGYVVDGAANGMREGDGIDRRSALRQRLVDRIRALAGDNDASGVLLAVAVGARHRISSEQWEQYAVSGTSHLMAISGLHIGLAAGGAWLLSRLLFSAVCRSTNVLDLAALTAVVAAFAYTEVSGFAVPARRALLMALLMVLALLLRRQLSSDKVIAVSCLAIFAADPLVIHAPGFKLSFGAVAILLWSARQRDFDASAGVSRLHRFAIAIRRLSMLQFTLLLGLFPMTSLIFGRVSWLAPAVNLLVLPVFNVVTVPAALTGLLLDGSLAPAGDRLILIAWYSVRGILWLVGCAAEWPPARIHTADVSGLALPLVLTVAVWAVAPPGFPGRRIAWVAAISVVLYKPPSPPPGCTDLTALDVGQGLSLVLRTHRRTLLFDTGPSFRGGSDAGQLVLVPYLRSIGATTVDLLIVSHAHDDHAGGAASLLEAIDVGEILAGEQVDSIERTQQRCRSGQAWLWDGVRFAIMHHGLYPLRGHSGNNNVSCVMEVAVGRHLILFTGDIEAPVENHLLRSGALSKAAVVVVPHHGSRTSSGRAFVRELRPAVALVSAGYANRWGFPREEVVARWQDAGAEVMNTAYSGAIQYRLCADSGLHLVSEHRIRHHRYWRDLNGE